MTKKKILLAAAAAVILGAVVYRMTGNKETVLYEVRPTVRAEHPKTGDITLYTDLTGRIEPQSQASVMPKIGGEVLEVYFQAGDQVQAGQALCRIDSDALTALKLQLDANEVALKDATSSVNRTRALFADGFVSQEAMEQAENGLQKARIAYESAKNQYDLQVEYTTVTAPINGRIESRNVDPHDHISPSSVLCTISGEEEIQVKFGVTEKIRRGLSLGDRISLEKNGTSYEGTIVECGTMVNAQTGLYDARAVVQSPDGLANGTRVKLVVVMDQTKNAMTVPLNAVNYEGGIPFVYCYESGIAEKTVIESGIYDNDRMEVLSGLSDDSLVITSWNNELVDGAEVLLAESGEDSEDLEETADGQVKLDE